MWYTARIIEDRQTDLSATKKPVLHHCNELLVTQFAITVGVKELEHDVDDMTVE